MCGIAGFGNMQVYLPGQGVHQCIDFHAKSPLATKADQWADIIVGETRDGFGFVLKATSMTLDTKPLQRLVAEGVLRSADNMGKERLGRNCWSGNQMG